MGDSRLLVLGLFVILLGSPFTANLGFSQEILFETTFDGQPNRSGDSVRAVIAGDFEIDLPVVVTDVHFFILDQAIAT